MLIKCIYVRKRICFFLYYTVMYSVVAIICTFKFCRKLEVSANHS